MTTDAKRILKLVMLTLLLVSALLPLSACSTQEPADTESTQTEDEPAEQSEETADESTEPPVTGIAWADIELTDVQTGETFTISEFTEGTVLIQAFAVW